MIRGALKIDLAKWTPFLDSITGEYAHGFSEPQDFDLFAVTGAKRIEDISFLRDRDAKISLSYLYRSEGDSEIPFPLEDKAYEGSSYRIKAQLLDLLSGRGPGNWNAGADWVQSLEDCDEWRCEVSIGWSF